VIFGAYFPAWMLIACIGIVAAVIARVASVATGVADDLPFPLAVCTSVGLVVAVIVWFVWFAL
jgi:hypothetical protein